MKKLLVGLLIWSLSITCLAQKLKYVEKNLPLYKIENREFNARIDSILFYSEQNIGEGLKYLNFIVDVREIEPNYYQLHFTLVDCIGMHLLLSSDSKNSAVGYFVFKKRNFFVSGIGYLGELYNITDKLRLFKAYGTDYLLSMDYPSWNYLFYAPDNKFELLSFYPVAVTAKERVYPICNDTIQ